MLRVLAIKGDNRDQTSPDFLLWRREIKMASFAAMLWLLPLGAFADQI